ncbi:MAG: LamG domain-containing protein, partial [Candidatus Pacebacteria bacterium]|nr:LamG domain-containing protein [Candidatus Paceibacterota bacterium]
GVDDYVDMGSGSSLNVTSAITIEAWIKPDALTPTWQTIVDRRSDGSTRQYGLLLNSDEVKFSFYNGGWQGTVTTSANLTIGNWYNITATYSDSANLTIIYINGIEIISAVENLSLTVDDTSVKIGIGYLGDAPFNGSIDDVRIYNRALSADEVRYHYNRGGPVGSWNFDEGSGLTAFDGTENNNDGTLKSSGLEFDGVDDYVAYSSDPPIGPVTFTAWFKTNDINQNQVIVGKIFGEVAFVRYGIGLIIHDFKVKGIYALNNVEWQQNLQYVIENDQWYHVAVTFSDGNGSVGQSDVTGKLYVNGELKAEHIGTATWYQDFKNAIGEGDPYGNNFNGSIDEVRIYNTALSAEEIARHYNNDFSQDPTANLVLLQHFEEGMACDANDEAGCLTDDSPSGTNDGTLKNFDNLTAWDNGTDGWVSEVKKPEWRWVNGKYKTAGEFNGWDDYVDGGDSDNLSPANAYTFSAWVKPTGTNIISLVDKGGIGGNREYRIALFNNSDVYNANYIQILIGDSSGNWAKIWYPNVVVQKDIWSHLAMTWDNSGSGPVKVYLNSVNVANSTYTGTLKNTTSDLLI